MSNPPSPTTEKRTRTGGAAGAAEISAEMAEESLKRLRITRRGNRATATKLERQAWGLMKDRRPESSVEDTEELVTKLSAILKTLKVKQDDLVKLDEEILQRCNVDHIEKEVDQANDVSSRIIEISERIEGFCKRVSAQDVVERVSTSTPQRNMLSGLNQSTSSSSSNGNQGVRLPKINLPRFRDKVTKFQSFWQSFKCSVDDNESLSAVMKMNYLVNSLEGPAYKAIEGLAITDENYEKAVEILKSRFGRSQEVIYSHMQELLKLQSHPNDNIAQIRAMYDNIVVQVRGLESLGITSENYGPLLIAVIMTRLPEDIQLQVSRISSMSIWKINEVMNIIEKEIEAREVVKKFGVAENKKSEKAIKPRSSSPAGTTKSFVAKEEKSRKIQCYFCKKEHFAESCRAVTDVKKRIEILNKAKRCLNCFKFGHQAKVCYSEKRCQNCNGKHNTAVCLKIEEATTTVQDSANTTDSSITTSAVKGTQDVLIQTAKTYAFGEDRSKKVPVNILFDSGSQKSYIAEKLRKKLSLKSEKTETINLNTFGTESFVKKNCERVLVNLEVQDEIVPITALSFPAICSPVSSRVEVGNYPHLTGLELANSVEHGDQEIGILIGADHYHDIVLGEVIKGSSGPVAIRSKLGWLLSGPTVSQNEKVTACSNVISTPVLDILPSKDEVTNENQEITESLKSFWQHESMGLVENENEANDKQCQSKTKIEFKDKDNRYEVSLPWKDETFDPLPSNYDMCKIRLMSLHRKLKGDPKLLEQYDAIFKEQLASGIIERVPQEKENDSDAHFLCHFGVVRSDRQTTKLRVVFDGSAKSGQTDLSLNDRLEIGENYMPLLFDTLVRFRTHKVALTADIEKAFLQIGISEDDRNVLRFLWFDDAGKDNPTIVQFRYCSLVFGLRCSPAILGETIRHHVSQFEEECPEVVKILNRLYADDLSCGTESGEEALEIYAKSKEIMMKGGFNLRKWNSNNKDLLSKIASMENEVRSQGNEEGKIVEDDQSYSQFAVGTPSNGESTKVLGVNWDSDSDTFYLDLAHVVEFAKSLPPTKRSVLRITAKIFDPLGCLCVFTINLKAFFQRLCINKIDWDEELQGNDRKMYESLVAELEKFHQLGISRCLFSEDKQVKKIEIHGFSDASERAYATVVYLRIEYVTGEVQVKFVSSKSKVAPIKQQSIPRLELLGACLMAKLVNNIRDILQDELPGKIVQTFYWVDSMSALCWIKNVKPWTQYIRHRVSEILKTSDRDQWFYCPGPQNPADLPSRGKFSNLAANRLWWEGPEFLKGNPENWPKSPSGSELESESAMKEKLKNDPKITHSMLVSDISSQPRIDKILDLSRFSTKGKLLRTIAWVMRFVSNLKSAREKSQLNKEEQVSVSEANNAENCLIRSIQSEAFSSEIAYLDSKSTTKPPLRVSQFNLFLDENRVLRCKTRVSNASLSESSKTPILLPPRNRYSELIVLECHNKVFHNGTRETLNLVRQKYWILRGREKVKSIVRYCVLCKKIEGLPYQSVFCPDLPDFRVDDAPPFTHVGIDFAGPLTVSNKENAKCYVCLFTCASTRAVHLELTETLDVEAFIRAFRRFSARGGLPATVISDNAKTFKSASKEVRRLLRSPRLRNHFSLQGVRWKFIVELSPWNGGMWERLIRSTKRCLIKNIGRSLLNYAELGTILVEIERVINSRPLTYVFDDQEGITYPLTPSQLVNGRNLSMMPNESHHEVVSTHESLSKRARYHQRVLSQFTKRWRNEYLLSLLEAYRPRNGSKEPPINTGDIVILRNDFTKRCFWKLCKVVELLKGRDGSVRAARVQVASSDGNKKVLNRALKFLIPLEIHASPALCHSDTQAQKTVQAPTQPLQRATRSKRAAAVIGEIVRRDNERF